MTVRAVLRNLRVAPSKVRPILDMVRGRKVEEAIQLLSFLPSPTAQQVLKVVKSAAANAENTGAVDPDALQIVGIYADAGSSLKRFRARARGRVGRIIKRSSHVTVLVDEGRGSVGT